MPQAIAPSEPQHRSTAFSDTAMELGEQALDRATEAAVAARDAVKDNPIATVAIIAGLAFAVGALWKIRRPGHPTRAESLRARLADLQGQLPGRWRA